MKQWVSRNALSILALVVFFGGSAIGGFLIVEFNDTPTTKNGNGNVVSVMSPVKDSQKVGAPTHSAETYVFYMRDCEDYDSVPCVTWDENEWRMVTSYSPYHSVTLTHCANEDGGTILPCLYVSKNARDLSPYYVFTRDVEFR